MLSGILRLALGTQHSMILEQHGRVWSAGVASHETVSTRFEKIIFSGATALAAGIDHSLALMQDGRVWALGGNLHGQLGDGTRTRKDIFFFVRRIAGAKAVAAGGEGRASPSSREGFHAGRARCTPSSFRGFRRSGQRHCRLFPSLARSR